MRPLGMKVGELAKHTGVSIRALHYYDEIGLLSPSLRTESGHRLYTAEDIARLQQIKSLQQLSFSLEQIGQCLEEPEFSPQHVIELHLARLKEQIELQHRLYERLEALAAHFRAAEEVSVEQFLQTIEVMTMYEKYYTPEQLEELKQRKEQIGEDHIRQVQDEWSQIYEQYRAEMTKGTDPTSEPVQQLARRSLELIQEFTGGNPGIEKSLNNMYQQEGAAPLNQHGMNVDPALWEYVGKAMEAARKSQ